MLIHRAYFRLSVALAFLSVTSLTTSAYGQSPPIRPGAADSEGAAAAKKVVAEDPRPGDLEKEVTAVKAENVALKEQLRKIDEQQKAMLEQFKLLQQRLEGSTMAGDTLPAKTPAASPGADAPVPSTAGGPTPSPPVPPAQAKSTDDDHYQDGIV